jgi:hypothetical protein
MDKSATILEAQWMEREIPRIREELAALKKQEQALLTAPLESVSNAYQTAYRETMAGMAPFYRRRRRVVPTRYGYRERMAEAGWLSITYKVLMTILAALGVYIAYTSHQAGHTQRGIIWASVLLGIGIVLSFAPMLGAYLWEREARQRAERAVSEARDSEAFRREKRERRASLHECQSRVAELEERLRIAQLRYDDLRDGLTRGNHRDVFPQ